MSVRNMLLAVSAVAALAAASAQGTALADERRPSASEAGELAELQRALNAAAARINRSNTEKGAMLAAAKKRDAEAVRAILTRNGFPESGQRESLVKLMRRSGIEFDPFPGGSEERLGIELQASCCPFSIKLISRIPRERAEYPEKSK